MIRIWLRVTIIFRWVLLVPLAAIVGLLKAWVWLADRLYWLSLGGRVPFTLLEHTYLSWTLEWMKVIGIAPNTKNTVVGCGLCDIWALFDVVSEHWQEKHERTATH